MVNVGIRELRQNLSRYVERVKTGEAFTVTDHGREVARLVPSGPPDSAIARLVAERGATQPRGDLLDAYISGQAPPTAGGPPSEVVLRDLREERL
jgi:prevent-host-death family protein